MTQLAVQQVDLASLMIECSHLPERECGELARRLFNDTFLDTARRGVRKTHDGHDVYIFPDRLKHCFYEKETRTSIDRIRLQRLAWILPMLQGRVSRSECWEADEIDCTRRMYLTFDHGYIVWLRSRDIADEGWVLRTGYNVSPRQLRRYIRDARKIAQF